MGQYLLSVHSLEGEVAEQPKPEEMQAYMAGIAELEADMDANGAFVFGGHLFDSDAATVVRVKDGDVVMTDGPFVESKEHVAGFYIINADDLDAALAWAGKVGNAVNRPIEVRPFAASGRVQG